MNDHPVPVNASSNSPFDAIKNTTEGGTGMTHEQQLRGRTRLAWATGIAGVIAGMILHAIITMPPVWLDDLQAVSTCLP